ncbi:MAG TPA: hypothetical protein VIZ17_16600 [Acetobacteraceae bacterium]
MPISFNGCHTIGSAGMRWSTGGSLPAFTNSASIGASANFFGHFAGSVIIVGPWMSPTRPDCDRLVCASATAPRRNSMAARAASTRRRDNSSFDMGALPHDEMLRAIYRWDWRLASATPPPAACL